MFFPQTRSLLEYVARTREQYGLIECTGKNAIGIQREPCRFLIVPAAGPYFPYSCMVSNQSDSTLSIRCDGSIVNNSVIGGGGGGGERSMVDEGHRARMQHDDEDDVGEDGEEEDEEELVGGGVTSRLKYHFHKRPEEVNSGGGLNLSTSDIYAMYFAPDAKADTDEAGDGQPLTRLTYRNGGLVPHDKTTIQLKTSASVLLDELVQKFNSHPLSQQPHLLVYPPTNYICEIYALLPVPTLIKVRSCVDCNIWIKLVVICRMSPSMLLAGVS